MERRKFIAGLGSLTAAGAAGIGTGAFTSVSANRGLEVSTADDSNALLGIEAMNTSNGNEYVDEGGNTVSIDISSDDGGLGLNEDASTIIRDMLKITNQGSQEVYVWFEGVPDGLSVFHDDPDFPKAENTGNPSDYTGNLDDPGTGRFEPSDPDASESDLYFKAPNLGAGDSLENIGLYVPNNNDEIDFDDDITIVAKTLEEAEA